MLQLRYGVFRWNDGRCYRAGEAVKVYRDADAARNCAVVLTESELDEVPGYVVRPFVVAVQDQRAGALMMAC